MHPAIAFLAGWLLGGASDKRAPEPPSPKPKPKPTEGPGQQPDREGKDNQVDGNPNVDKSPEPPKPEAPEPPKPIEVKVVNKRPGLLGGV